MNHPGGTCFEDMKGSWTAKIWYCERPGEAIGEGTASITTETSKLKGACRELRLGIRKGAQERLGQSAGQL